MAVTEQNFKMFQGDHKVLLFTVEDMEDLTEAKIRWKVALRPTSEPLIIKSTENAGQIYIENNTFRVEINKEDTLPLDTRRTYYHEAEITDDAGYPSTVSTGKMKVHSTLIK